MTQSDPQGIYKPNFAGLFKNEDDVVTLEAGKDLFGKGDAGDSMFVVLDGTLTVGDGNKIYEELSPGDLVGEMALIDHAPRAATVTATSDSKLARIDQKRFLFLTQQTPMFALNVMRILSQRLRRMDMMVGG